MLFHSTLRKELSRTFGATFVVLVTIVMTIILIRTLGLASRGSVNPSEVFLVMLYTVVGFLPTILSLALFIAIVGTLSRMYRDSEMVIWLSSGRGVANFVHPLFRFSWPVLVLIAVLAVFGRPWATTQTEGMREQYERRGDLDRVAPGEFQESPGRSRVFFVDKGADGTSAANVFISSYERGLQIVTSARSGRIETENGVRYLTLQNGQRIESAPDKRGLKISEFDSYSTRVGTERVTTGDERPARMLPTRTLLAQTDAPSEGELSWRIGMVLAAINFVLLALALSGASPRASRSANSLFALFSFVIYYNLLSLGESWIGSGRFGIAGFMLALHGGVLFMTLLWLAKRHSNWRRPRMRAGASS